MNHKEVQMDRKVKGTWFADYVKLIRANKKYNPEFDQYLQPEDWQLINSKILPSQWYAFESYKRIGRAIFNVIAKSDLQITRQFGRLIANNLLPIYKNMVVKGDAAASVTKLVQLHETFFREIESRTHIIEQDKNHITIKLILSATDMIDEMAEPFAWQLAGKMEELAVQASSSQVQLRVKKNPRDFEILLSW
jgi:hypothetical protein